MSGGLWRPVAVVSVMLAVLTLLLLQSRSGDLVLFEHMHAALRNYELHDAELTRDVLTARAGLAANYDALAADRKRLQTTLEALQEQGATGSKDVESLLQQPIEQMGQLQIAKLSDVERFKSANALLRNSLMYLTFAGPVLHLPESNKRLSAETSRLSFAVLRYVQSPDPAVAGEIQGILDKLEIGVVPRSDLATLIAHGRLIVTLAPQTDALLDRILQARTSERAHELQAAVLRENNRVEARAQVFRVLLYAMALLLLSYVVFQFVRLRTAARVLRRANISLQRETDQHAAAAAALRISEGRFRAISESANEAIVSVAAGGAITSWNAGAAAMFGYARDEILGRPFTRLTPERYRNAHERAISQLLDLDQSRPASGTRELAGLRKGGAEFPLEVSLAVWETDEGRFLTAIMRDVSERKRLEETARQRELQLIQSNRMAVMGQLVSFVVHEINNPTHVILENSATVGDACNELLQLLDERVELPPETKLAGLPYLETRERLPTMADDIRAMAIQIARNVADLRDFYSPKPSDGAAEFDLNDAVKRCVRLLTHMVRKRTHNFRVELAPNLPAAFGDLQQVEQILMNLVTNALEALPDASHGVLVSTAHRASPQALLVVVEDEGVGIPASDIGRVCDAYFTTKRSTGGTGLGLAITSILVKAVGGKLRFESDLGKGTRAIVELRCAPRRAAPDHPIDARVADATHD